ncbi:MAG: transporter substrate-binding domain-containing protein [Acidobacteria bacterium]|nr:transporter substrate-binding domain-containing protein [Acidobacteriota bacterium]
MRDLKFIAILLFAALSLVATARAQSRPDIPLTDEEQAWLAENQRIRIAPAPNFPPVEFFDDQGVYRGIAADYVSLLESRLGIQLEVQRRDTWNQVVEDTQRGEIDVWMEAAYTAERSRYMLFTEPYLELPAVIIVRREMGGQLTLDDFEGLTVAVIEGYASQDYVRENYPELELVPVPDIQTGLERVTFGSADAVVANIAAASYYIERSGMTNLRVAGQSGFVWELSIVSRKDWPLLSGIFQKGLDSISFEEHQEIRRRWISLESAEEEFSLLEIALGILVLLVVLILGIRMWRGGEARSVLEEATLKSAWPTLVTCTAAICVVVVAALWTWVTVEERARQDTGNALNTVLNTTSNAVYDWFREREQETRTLAGRQEFQGHCQELIGFEVAGALDEALSARNRLNEELDPLLAGREYEGFVLLSSDGRVLAGTDLEQLERSRPYELSTEFFNGILQGSNSTSTRVPERVTEPGDNTLAPSSILVGSAIMDGENQIQCILVLLANPERSFTEILQRGRIGESGESYAFNQKGQLLSESRFNEQLRRIGVIEEGQDSNLNVEIRDPGGNLVTGYDPQLPRQEQPLTFMAQKAIDGDSGNDLEGYRDYRGVPVIGAWAWDASKGLGIVTEIDVGEAYAFLSAYQRQTIASTALGISLILGLSGLFIWNRMKIGAANIALAKGAEELEKRNRFIRQTFGRYLSDDIVENILETPAGLKIGGETRLVTIMMTDIRGFTALGKQLPAETIVSMLNIYLEQMTDIIFKYKGTIDEFIGDAILVIFGAPFTQEDDAQRAAACALEMQVAMGDVNLQFREAGFPEVEMGIGLNTGEVVVGNIGSSKRSKYGVVGHNVNLTSRIESYTVGGQILISQATREKCGPLLEIGGSREVMPKGVDQPITIFDVKGMGEPYDIHLPETTQEELCPLEQCLEMEFSVVEQKEVGKEVYRGEVTALSDTTAALRCDFVPEIAQNLKVTLYPQNLEKGLSDIYTKVTQHESDSPDRFVVHFTSVPPASQSFLEELTRTADKSQET